MAHPYPPPPNNPPPRPSGNRYTWVFILLGAIAAFIVISQATTATTKAPTSSGGAATAIPTAAATPAGPAGSIGAGVHVVGVDIQPGNYRTAGPVDSVIPNCYWARLKNTDGEFGAIIANGNTEGRATVTIKKTDGAFETTGCQPWTKAG
jgi:hypothetical protein